MDSEIVFVEEKKLPSAKDKKHKCFGCLMSFSDFSGLVLHTKESHKGPKGFVCDFCDKLFTSKNISEIQTHFKKNHYEPHKCAVCKSSFDYVSDLTLHMNKTHKGPKGYFCDFCDVTFKTCDELTKHYKEVHSSPVQNVYECKKCEKTFDSEEDFNRHEEMGFHEKKKTSENQAVEVIEVDEPAIVEKTCL